MFKLRIKQFKSSAYHPGSQGAIERFHHTLITMIKSYCFNTEKSWDESYLQVCTKITFQSIWVSFCHAVRGPLKILKKTILSDSSNSLNLLQYVSNFRTRLTKAFDVAKSNLKSAQDIMKTHFDLDSFRPSWKLVNCKFEPGACFTSHSWNTMRTSVSWTVCNKREKEWWKLYLTEEAFTWISMRFSRCINKDEHDTPSRGYTQQCLPD